jgi:hypothetical protein
MRAKNGMRLGALATTTACAISYVATDGSAVVGQVAAVEASSSHDLNCPKERTFVVPHDSRTVTEYIADGCGQRAVYQILGGHIVLISRVSLTPSSPGP